jgi:hypothetical protein
MPIEFKKNRATFRDEVSVEEAEGLLEWLQNHTHRQGGSVGIAPTCTPPTCKC